MAALTAFSPATHTIMNVFTYNTQRRYSINDQAVAALVEEIITAEGRSCDEVAIHFVGTTKISRLHAEYFDDPTVTDCISFPMDSDNSTGYQVLGEVFVCPEIAARYVARHGGELHVEISLYIAHGILHLLGYDDIDDADRLVMRQREQFHIDNLTAKGLLLPKE
jgi:probable rRNA maturation factor